MFSITLSISTRHSIILQLFLSHLARIAPFPTKLRWNVAQPKRCIWHQGLITQEIYELIIQSCNIQVALTRKLRTKLLWRHNEPDGVSNHQPHDCLFNHLFGHRSKKTSKLCVTGLSPSQMASNAENVSIWWRHHVFRWRYRPHLWPSESIKCQLKHKQFHHNFNQGLTNCPQFPETQWF